ncbi:MAG TPA: amidase family protein, partial [Bryobacteraceae bacterium]|nr:amidase family protein [Bryobacteraceae bacterium]
MKRRTFLQVSLLGGGAALSGPAQSGPSRLSAVPVKPFDLEEATTAELQAGMKASQYTARSIVEKYLARIDEIDKRGPAINAVIEINPDALAIADALDKERREKGVRGPLHGIPVLIKDNIDTADRMMTTAGS